MEEKIKMVNITKEKIMAHSYEEVPQWKVKKSKWGAVKEFTKTHKFMTAVISILIAAVAVNVVLLYSFFNILSTI